MGMFLMAPLTTISNYRISHISAINPIDNEIWLARHLLAANLARASVTGAPHSFFIKTKNLLCPLLARGGWVLAGDAEEVLFRFLRSNLAYQILPKRPFRLHGDSHSIDIWPTLGIHRRNLASHVLGEKLV